MLKKSVLEVRELEKSFTRFREQRAANAEGVVAEEEHRIYAADLAWRSIEPIY